MWPTDRFFHGKTFVKPTDKVLGAMSLRNALGCVCVSHLAICIFFVATVDSLTVRHLGGLKLSPLAQSVNGAWNLLGVPVIICGGVGTIFLVKNMVKIYYYYAFGSVLYAMAFLLSLSLLGSDCSDMPGNTCGLLNSYAYAITLLWILILGTFVYLIWSMTWYIEKVRLGDMLRYQEPVEAQTQLNDDSLEEECRQRFVQRWVDSGTYGVGHGYYQKPLGPDPPSVAHDCGMRMPPRGAGNNSDAEEARMGLGGGPSIAHAGVVNRRPPTYLPGSTLETNIPSYNPSDHVVNK